MARVCGTVRSDNSELQFGFINQVAIQMSKVYFVLDDVIEMAVQLGGHTGCQ